MTHAETRRVGPRRPLQIVSPDEVRRIHDLARHPRARSAVSTTRDRPSTCSPRPAPQVDYETTVAKLPPELVERALATLPHGFTLGGRTPALRPAARRRARLHHLGRLRHLRARARRHGAPLDQGRRERRGEGRPGPRQHLRHLGAGLGPGLPRRDARAARVRRLHARLRKARHRRLGQRRDRGARPDPHGRSRGRRRRGSSTSARPSRSSCAP